MAELNIDLSNVEVSAPGNGEKREFKALPAGEYIVRAVSSEVKATKAGTGQYLKVRFDVVDGDHAGRVLFTNFNIQNPSEKAQEIGRQQLKQLAVAVGLPNPNAIERSEDLHDIAVTAYVKRVRNEQYGDSDGFQNEIANYKAVSGAPLATPAAGGSAPSEDLPF